MNWSTTYYSPETLLYLESNAYEKRNGAVEEIKKLLSSLARRADAERGRY